MLEDELPGTFNPGVEASPWTRASVFNRPTKHYSPIVSVQQVRGQPGEAPAVRHGLQPGNLLETPGSPQDNQGLVPAERAGEADQARRAAGAPRPKAGVPVGRSGRATCPILERPGSHRPVISAPG